MADNHLQVPDSSQNLSNGRQRSGSVRLQRSQRTTQQNNGGLPVPEIADFGQRSSIRIRRTSVIAGPAQDVAQNTEPQAIEGRSGNTRRSRSVSEPQRGQVPPVVTPRVNFMPEVSEELTSSTTETLRESLRVPPTVPEGRAPSPNPSVGARSSIVGITNWRPLRRARGNIAAENPAPDSRQDEYDSTMVDLLDLVDPEVATLQTLTNVQNSLFVPDLGRYLNRRPTYNLTRLQSDLEEGSTSSSDGGEESKETTRVPPQRRASGATLQTISSNVNEQYYAVLPHGVSLSGWNEEEKLELNDHVRHMLHSRRSRFTRGMRGFRQYVKKPLGAFVTIYATLITIFGLIWVLFLIGWISVGNRKSYIVNVIDNVLVALFAIVGDGLAPFRAVDTYHMCFIAHYHHLTWRLRREKSLPKLQNQNDLPAIQLSEVQEADIEKQEFSVLTPKQQKSLAHHQKKFGSSHSFYKPHETYTHHAFPLNLLVAIVVLLDCHSLLQIALGTCTWAISYHNRPFALTTVILCCSITCNITAGVLISVGDHKTRKKDVREKMFRQELTAEALKEVEKRRRRERREAGRVVEEGGMGEGPIPEMEIIKVG